MVKLILVDPRTFKRSGNNLQIKSYFIWRSSNAAYVQQRYATYIGPNPNIPPIIKKIMNPLTLFTEMGLHSDYSQTRVEKELGSIITNAIKLDADM